VIGAGLDIGGANIKAARSDGCAVSVAFPLWKTPESLEERLVAILDDLDAFDRLAVTMTGELCDCFATRAEGVAHILQSVDAACRRVGVSQQSVRVWSLDQDFVTLDEAAARPHDVAAANWLALAAHVAAIDAHDRGVLVDVGSTTTDIVPFEAGRAVPRGRTDTDRLTTGELVYSGARRTPLCALVGSVRHRGAECRVAAELFATTLDAYIVLGEVAERTDDVDTADGRPATRECARARLARLVCRDPDEFTSGDALEIAEQTAAAQIEALDSALRRAVDHPSRVDRWVVSGSGEFLARRLVAPYLAGDAPLRSLAARVGQSASIAACAWVLAQRVAGRSL